MSRFTSVCNFKARDRDLAAKVGGYPAMMSSLLAAAAAALCLSHAIASHANVTNFRVLARCTSGADQRDGGTSTLPNCLRAVRSTLRWCWWKWAIFLVHLSGHERTRKGLVWRILAVPDAFDSGLNNISRARAPFGRTSSLQFTPVHSSLLEFTPVPSGSNRSELPRPVHSTPNGQEEFELE